MVPTAPPMKPSHVFFGDNLMSGVRPQNLPANHHLFAHWPCTSHRPTVPGLPGAAAAAHATLQWYRGWYRRHRAWSAWHSSRAV